MLVRILVNFPFEGDERKLDRLSAPYTNSMTETPGAKDLVDLEVIIRNWAKQIFEVTKTREEAKINRKHLEVLLANLS
ncbi:unnamed protein product [Gongylonema pulchrum]|uniref:DUF4160 domain-containing protein n=1 Tax=Gongylonema pulchrum TaxID=637853 RepID=A0A183ERN0_9BILA|nr:unnamed protein product [Gongylonema pulchrum]